MSSSPSPQSSAHNHPKKPPKTDTPDGVIWLLGGILALLTVGLMVLPNVLFGLSPIWGLAATPLAIRAALPSIIIEVPAFKAIVLMDSITGAQRVLFQGWFRNIKLPWEMPQTYEGKRFVDLLMDLHETVPEKCPAKDSEVVVTYTITQRPRWETSEDIRKYISFKSAALLQESKTLVGRLITDYIASKDGEFLIENKTRVRNDLFTGNTSSAVELRCFEEKHGIDLEIDIEGIDRVASVQEVKDIVAKAESFNAAVEELKKKGMSEEAAQALVTRMLYPDTVQDFNFRGLEGMQSFFMGTGPGGAFPGGERQKKGKK